MATPHHTVEWIDGEREPAQKANPQFPDGIAVDASGGRESCLVPLPYPAKRIGLYTVVCNRCQATAAVTTAGRRDDPRSIKMPCRPVV